MLDDYVREMTVKESCKCDKYGSFEDVLFLFLLFVSVYEDLDCVQVIFNKSVDRL